MEIWAILAIIGATAQSLRTVCQKILVPRTGELGASFSRLFMALHSPGYVPLLFAFKQIAPCLT